MVFYEAPHKLLRTLEDLHQVLGDRPIRPGAGDHQDPRRGVPHHFGPGGGTLPGKPAPGEFVLVLAGAPKPQEDEAPPDPMRRWKPCWPRAVPSARRSSGPPKSWACQKTAFTTRPWSGFHKRNRRTLQAAAKNAARSPAKAAQTAQRVFLMPTAALYRAMQYRLVSLEPSITAAIKPAGLSGPQCWMISLPMDRAPLPEKGRSRARGMHSAGMPQGAHQGL